MNYEAKSSDITSRIGCGRTPNGRVSHMFLLVCLFNFQDNFVMFYFIVVIDVYRNSVSFFVTEVIH